MSTFARPKELPPCFVQRERDYHPTDYLRLEGPFEYPVWVSAAEATPMSNAKAMLCAEYLKPHRSFYVLGAIKIMAVAVDVVAAKMRRAS